MRKNNSLFGLLAGLAILMFAACGGSKTPADIEISIWKQVQKGNYEKAMQTVIDNSIRSEGDTPEKQKEFVSAFAGKVKASCEEKGGIKDIQLVEETFSEDGNSAKVILNVTYNNGTNKEEKGKYKKIDGKWKIDMSK